MRLSWLQAALDALAVFRLTRLTVEDSITSPLRDRLIGRRPGQAMSLGGERIMIAKRPRVAELLSCPWCVSPWLAVVVVACQALAPGLWLYPSAVLAFSATAGLLSHP